MLCLRDLCPHVYSGLLLHFLNAPVFPHPPVDAQVGYLQPGAIMNKAPANSCVQDRFCGHIIYLGKSPAVQLLGHRAGRIV